MNKHALSWADLHDKTAYPVPHSERQLALFKVLVGMLGFILYVAGLFILLNI